MDEELEINTDFTDQELEVTPKELLEARKLLQHTAETVVRDEYVLCRLISEKQELGKMPKEEMLRLRVLYSVRSPYFMLDLDGDELDFGPVVIGNVYITNTIHISNIYPLPR